MIQKRQKIIFLITCVFCKTTSASSLWNAFTSSLQSVSESVTYLAGQVYDGKIKLPPQSPAAGGSAMSLQDTVNLLRDPNGQTENDEQIDPEWLSEEWPSEFQDVKVTACGGVLTESVLIKDKPKSVENKIVLYLCAHATKDPAKPFSITVDDQLGIYKVTYTEVITNSYRTIWFNTSGEIISSMKAASL